MIWPGGSKDLISLWGGISAQDRQIDRQIPTQLFGRYVLKKKRNYNKEKKSPAGQKIGGVPSDKQANTKAKSHPYDIDTWPEDAHLDLTMVRASQLRK